MIHSGTAGTKSVGKRTRLQAEQKKIYRDKLLIAARALLRKRTYNSISIDDIAIKADVSRATFYRHFRNKLEIVAALTDNLVDSLHPAHDIFLDLDTVDEEAIGTWISAYIASYRKHAAFIRAIREAAAIEPIYFRDHALRNHDRTIRKLGRTLPAFRHAGETGKLSVRMRAHLLIRQLDAFCYDVAVAHWDESIEIGRAMLARQFMAFLTECGTG